MLLIAQTCVSESHISTSYQTKYQQYIQKQTTLTLYLYKEQ